MSRMLCMPHIISTRLVFLAPRNLRCAAMRGMGRVHTAMACIAMWAVTPRQGEMGVTRVWVGVTRGAWVGVCIVRLQEGDCLHVAHLLCVIATEDMVAVTLQGVSEGITMIERMITEGGYTRGVMRVSMVLTRGVI